MATRVIVIRTAYRIIDGLPQEFVTTVIGCPRQALYGQLRA